MRLEDAFRAAAGRSASGASPPHDGNPVTAKEKSAGRGPADFVADELGV
jgi:hypothetical protein